MTQVSRGPLLTIFAILFAIVALSNFLKPFHLDADVGFVFLGMKTHGAANAILGPAFGALLLAYAIGIWRMRRWVLPIAYSYAAYVVANLSLFMTRTHATTAQPPSPVFMILYVVVAIGVSTGCAVVLHRRRLDLT
jgi:hypothetical protein